MDNEPAQTGHLWALVQAWLDAQRFPPSQAKIAKDIGVSKSTISDWKYGRSLGASEGLRGLADAIGLPYTTVLAAALRDSGYLRGTMVGAQEAAELLAEVQRQTRQSQETHHPDNPEQRRNSAS